MFVQAFSATPGLVAAVRRLGVSALVLSDIDSTTIIREVSKLIKTKRVGWLHCAPQQKQVPIRAVARLCRLQHRAGGFFSVEGASDGPLWTDPSVASLQLRGVRAFLGDWGGPCSSTSKWIANAPWFDLIERTWSGPPHRLGPISTLGNPAPVHSQSRPGTPPPAQLPADLCDALADAFRDALGTACAGRTRPRFSMHGTIDELTWPTKLELREQENAAALGGMRAPHRAADRIPNCRRVAAQVRECLEQVIFAHEEQIFQTLGALDHSGQVAEGFPAFIVEAAARSLSQHFGGTVSGACYTPGQINHALLRLLITAAGDPDDVLPDWAAGGTPLGITQAIPVRGIFPTSTGAAAETDPTLLEGTSCAAAEGNYASFLEHGALAEAELAKEWRLGYLRWAPNRATLEAEVGPLVPSKMAVLVNEKGGTTKVRVIHDLRRSGVNAAASIPERVVLPRLMDAAYSMIGVAQELQVGEAVEVAVVDFKDAFKHLRVHPSERRFLAGASRLDGIMGYFYYCTVLFGAIAGPLVWGRIAAYLMRLTAGMFEPGHVGLQCFVDDPIIAVRGSWRDRNLRLAAILLLWCALGFRLSWAKASRGTSVSWIGGTLSYVWARGELSGVEVTVQPEKIRKMAEIAGKFLEQQLLHRVRLREFAGLVTWIASVVPAMRPYAQMLWAAASAKPRGREDRLHVACRRASLPLRWCAAFTSKHRRFPSRHVPLAPDASVFVLAFDASLSGGGATLQCSLGGAIEYSSFIWSKRDASAIGARWLDPAAQPLWEAYALLCAVSTWAVALAGHQGRLVLHGDAQGVLQAVCRRRAREPRLNLIVAEIQLHLGAGIHDLTGVHFWSEENAVCDALSRRAEGATLPEVLVDATFVEPVVPERWLLLGGAEACDATCHGDKRMDDPMAESLVRKRRLMLSDF